MLRRFQVRNYRSIENETVYLEPLSVFVGPNGSGKTNFFRAMELFGELVFAGSTDAAMEEPWEEICYRGSRTTRTTMQFSASLKLNARVEDRPETVWVDVGVGLKHLSSEDTVVFTSESLSLRRTSRKKTSRFAIQIDRSGDVVVEPGADKALWELLLGSFYFERRRGKEELTADTVRSILEESTFAPVSRTDVEEGRFLRLSQLIRYTPWFTRNVVPQLRVRRFRLETAALRGQSSPLQSPPRGQLGLAGEGLPEVVDRLRRENRLRPVIEAMKAVMPGLTDVEPVRSNYGRKTLVFREADRERAVPESAISDGTLHTLALLALLAPERRVPVPTYGRILVLEELENAVHPWAIGALLRAARAAAGRAQVVISTHSPVVVDATPPSSLFVVERDGLGTDITPARHIRSDLSGRLARSGMTLGEVWLDGMLGGAPMGVADAKA